MASSRQLEAHSGSLVRQSENIIPDESAFEQKLPANGVNPYLARLGAFTQKSLVDANHSLISLFCGGGGLDLGLGFAGFATRLANDLIPSFVDTVEANLPGVVPSSSDIMKMSGSDLLKLAGLDEVDLVAAGPPCQAFSVLGRRGSLDDPRGQLALKYFQLISEMRPKAFLFENVPGLLSVNRGRDWQLLLEFASDITGYQIHWTKLNAVQFGIPQVRERVFVIGFREHGRSFRFPEGPTGPYGEQLVEAAWFRTPSDWALQYVDGLPNHVIRQHGDRVRSRYLRIPQGGRDKTDHTDRIHPSRPSGTVLVGSAAGGGRPHIHPYEPRVISVREGARLQSFPDWYVFEGTSTNQYRQVGNAVPPLVAYEVGRKIAKALQEE